MNDNFVDEHIKKFGNAALKRAVWTFAETAVGMITIGQAFTDVNWLHIISVSGVAAIVSFLKSIVVSMPEMKEE